MRENSVSEATFEFTVERFVQTIKKLWVVIIVLIVALIATNIAWIIYESQFETEYYSVEADNGNANYIGRDGDIVNGEGYSKETDEEVG